MSWNSKNRNSDIEKSKSAEFDLIIIGGGITGAGIARDITFCLVDKNDFAFGTSSRSSKLFHGGMRYLSQAEFGLVRESTTERNWLMKHLPNLVRPLGFMYCSYEKGKDKPFTIIFAVKMYDMLSNWFSPFKNFRKAKIFKADFIEEFEPNIALEVPELGKMKMAGFYYDTNCDDSRVTLEIIKESLVMSSGKSIAMNYVRAESFIKDSTGKAKGITAKDILSGNTFEISGKAVVSAVGIWTDEMLEKAGFTESKIYPTKGVHLIVPNERLGNRNAFGIRSLDDGRFYFILRRGKVSVIGTTDTAYYPESKNLDEPWCKKEDADYLLRTVNKLFPHAMLTYKDIIGTYAGIRPLIKQSGAKKESDVSRTHEIFETKDGVVAIGGGKSTTHRRMAEDLLFFMVKRGYLPSFKKSEYQAKSFSKKPFLVGMTRIDFDMVVKEKGLASVSYPDQLEYLHQQFGKQGITILEQIKNNPKSGEELISGYPHCAAEIDFILENENAPNLVDVLCRRTEAQWMVWHFRQKELAEKVADIMADYYDWSAEQKNKQIADYLEYVRKTVEFLL